MAKWNKPHHYTDDRTPTRYWWRTISGDVWFLKDLEDEHLDNILHWLESRGMEAFARVTRGDSAIAPEEYSGLVAEAACSPFRRPGTAWSYYALLAERRRRVIRQLRFSIDVDASNPTSPSTPQDDGEPSRPSSPKLLTVRRGEAS